MSIAIFSKWTKQKRCSMNKDFVKELIAALVVVLLTSVLAFAE
jgi:hypothetical protein